MKKEKFVEIMNEIEELERIEREINTALGKLDDGFGNYNFISFSKYENLIIKIFEEAMNDLPREWDSWISWWICEADFGKNKIIALTASKTGFNKKVKNAGDLYDLITFK